MIEGDDVDAALCCPRHAAGTVGRDLDSLRAEVELERSRTVA